jgi:hypothetical protein
VVGYARTSTAEQEAGLAAQERDLRAAGCGKVFAERVSSVGQRARLDAALDFLRGGDVLVVTRPDRLARSVADLLGIVGKLDAKGAALHVMSMGGNALDTGTATSRMMLTVLGAVAEFERTLMINRETCTGPPTCRHAPPRSRACSAPLPTLVRVQPPSSRCTCAAENAFPVAVTKPSAANSAAISRRLRASPVFGDFRASRLASRISFGFVSA